MHQRSPSGYAHDMHNSFKYCKVGQAHFHWLNLTARFQSLLLLPLFLSLTFLCVIAALM